MKIFVKYVMPVITKKNISFLLYTLIIAILILLYALFENIINLKSAVVLLFILVTVQVVLLMCFLKIQFINEIIKTNDDFEINQLKESLRSAESLAYHRAMYFEKLNDEILTPLNTVFGMLSMLKKTNLNIDQRAQVEIAEYSASYLLQLINIVFENNNFNEKDLKLNASPLYLKSNLTKLFEILEFQAWEKNLDFEYTFLAKEKERFLVLGDAYKIQQVLINLINNALKYTDSGKISIIVDQTVSIGDEQIITFYIKDTGIGLSPNEIKNVSNIFNGIGTDPVKMDYCGRGLGLSISHKLVKLMGGELKLESEAYEGATFYFSLSLKKTLNISTATETPKPNLIRKFNVLVAEDSKMSQRVIKYLLERQGADCTFAKDGLEALKLYKKLDFDLILMDIYMPGMDGYIATKHIKATNKYEINKTPIIAVSASSFEKDIKKAESAGIDDFLAKPIDDGLLKKLLLKHLKIKILNGPFCYKK